jgi:hypothetical protein
MIDRTEKEIRKNLTKDGRLFLLFDPIPMEDLQLDKSFTYTGIRKKILPDYKANRTFSPFYVSSMHAFKKYYAYRGPNVIEIFSDEYEADDYVEWAIGQAGEGKSVALWTTDADWARYIAEGPNFRIDMINNSFKKPYTVGDFKKEYGFLPTPAANALYKALFGDKSDNIHGAIFMKKAKFVVPIKTISLEAVRYVSYGGYTVGKLYKELRRQNFEVNEDSNQLEKLVDVLRSAEPRLNVLEKIHQNLSAVLSLCEDASKFATWNEEKPEMNKILREAIVGEKTPLAKKFGKF